MPIIDVLGPEAKQRFSALIHCVQPLVRASRASGVLHKQLVVHCCVNCGNVVQEIGYLEFSPVGFALCRTVLEIAASTLYLAKKPEELDDFQAFGEFEHLILSGVKKDEDSESGKQRRILEQRFEKKRKRGDRGGKYPTWHGFTMKRLLSHGPMSGLLKDYASIFLHGDSFVATASMTEQGGEYLARPFQAFFVHPGIPVCVAIEIYSLLLDETDRILELNCAAQIDEMKTIKSSLLTGGTE